MFAILHSLAMFVIDLFKSPRRLEAENLFLRHQLSIALRRAPPRLRLRGSDRALMVWLTRLWPSLLGAAQVVQPETILRWHRAGFAAFWRWKSRKRAGRPKIGRELRDVIRRMSKENPKWGASRIHGELLMLGFEVAQSTVSKYMVQGGSPWQNPYVERLIGTVRRECLDRVLIFGEAHLRQILSSYAAYYNEVRTHLALGKDAPAGRAVQRSGAIVAIPILCGLHHHYVRI